MNPTPPNSFPVIRKTLIRFNTPGNAHCLTFSCFQRRAFLKNGLPRKWFADSVARAQTIHNFDVWAYVIMPEHVHILIYPREPNYDIGAILKSIKRSVTEKAIQYSKSSDKPESSWRACQDIDDDRTVHFRFWQIGGGYDRNIWSPQETREKIEYIHNNPVRRGLCETAKDWEWSSAADYAGVRKGPITITLDSLAIA